MPGRAVCAGPNGPFVPQKMYKPPTNSDRLRYVEQVELEEPIIFTVENPHEDGIPLVDALNSRVKRLAQRDETVFEGRGPSISIRLVVSSHLLQCILPSHIFPVALLSSMVETDSDQRFQKSTRTNYPG
jgi:hypothetical protein